MAILIGLVILAAVAYYVSRPLTQSRRAVTANGPDTLSLAAQRDTLYTQIKELDMDHATGKVNDDDYARVRADLMAQATEVLKQIDGVAQQPASAPVAATLDDEIEALIAARRKTAPVPAPARATDADVEAAIAARRKTAASKTGAATLACPRCGKPITADDVFFSKCGTALLPQTAH